MNGTKETKSDRQLLLEQVLEVVRELESGNSTDPDLPTIYHQYPNPNRKSPHVYEVVYKTDETGTYRGSELMVCGGGPSIWIDTRFNTVIGQCGSDLIHRRYDDRFDLDDHYEERFERTR